MFQHFSIKDLACIALLLDEDEKRTTKSHRKCVRETLSKINSAEQRETATISQPELVIVDDESKRNRTWFQDTERKRKFDDESGTESLEFVNNDSKRRVWVNDKLRNRKTEGEFALLYPELLEDEGRFYNYFKMSRQQFSILLSKIEGDITKMNTTFREAIGPEEKLAVCLRFLTTGYSFTNIASSYRLGNTTVPKIVLETCEAIIKRLMPEVMPQPTEEEWEQIADDFWNTRNFPNCLGVLIGKQVNIVTPPKSKSFSTILVALVDSKYQFTAVDVASFDTESDRWTFAHSNLSKNLESRCLNVPKDKALPGTQEKLPYVILGDEVFPMRPYLLRPYRENNNQKDQAKSDFNCMHSQVRKVSEKAFDRLFQKFGVYNQKLRSNPDKADKIVLTTCILYNFIRKHQVNDELDSGCVSNIKPYISAMPRIGGRISDTSSYVRDKFRDFFSLLKRDVKS